MNAAKRQCTNEGIENVNSVSNNMKITDLNADCLEEIFDHLCPSDLLSVADTCTRIRKVAGLVFIRKCGNERSIHIDNERIQCGWFNPLPSVHMDTTHQFLRCFGHLILKINFNCYEQSRSSGIFRYINEYCAETLTSLSVSALEEYIFDDISKPFTKLKFLSFNGCMLGGNLTNFNKWFPQMEELESLHNNMVDSKCIETQFMHLKRIVIHIPRSGFLPPNLNEENLEKFISLNTQLKVIVFSVFPCSIDLFRHMSKHLNQLDDLSIFNIMNEYHHPDPIHFKGVKKFQISPMLPEHHSTTINSFVFDQLEELTTHQILFNDLRDFVNKHSTITNLDINDYNDYLTVENIMEVSKALPSLSTLRVINRNRLSIDDAIRLISKLKQLQHFEFIGNDTNEATDLEQRLSNGWRVRSYDKNNRKVYLKRDSV